MSGAVSGSNLLYRRFDLFGVPQPRQSRLHRAGELVPGDSFVVGFVHGGGVERVWSRRIT
jgi:hypothetical protein